MRLYTIIVSMGAHVAALIVLIAVPLLAMDVVPIAYRVHAFVPAAAADLPDVPPPPRGGNPPVTREAAVPSTPTEAPDHIEEELPTPGPPSDRADGSWRRAEWCRRCGADGEYPAAPDAASSSRSGSSRR